jgi:hypothetical protein
MGLITVVERLESLEKRVDRLFRFFEGLLEEVEEIKDSLRPSTIQLRSILREEAKEEVLAYYLDRDLPMYPSDVADELRLDSLLVFQLTQELSAEGKIK